MEALEAMWYVKNTRIEEQAICRRLYEHKSEGQEVRYQMEVRDIENKSFGVDEVLYLYSWRKQAIPLQEVRTICVVLWKNAVAIVWGFAVLPTMETRALIISLHIRSYCIN